MASDHSVVPVSAHSQLKLHSIVPVSIPPRSARSRDASRSHESGASSSRDRAQGHQSDRNYRGRSDTFVVSNSSIFSSPIKQAAQVGSIPVHRPAKRAEETHQLERESRRQAQADPIAFDPFSDSPFYVWLAQDPSSSAASKQFRRDNTNLQGFRDWVSTKFPKVVGTFKSLHMLHDRPPPANFTDSPQDVAERRGHVRDALEESDSDDDEENVHTLESSADVRLARRRLIAQQREAQQQAWGILLESARLQSIPPGDVFVTADTTPARDVYFVLSGRCQLLFQPKFLHSVVQTRNGFKSNNVVRVAGSPSLPDRRKATQTPPRDVPIDPLELQSNLDALLAMRRLSLTTLTVAEASDATAHAVYPLQLLSYGDYFGLEACAFRFPHHFVSAVSQGALHRNEIGVATPACLHVLALPFHALERMRLLIHSTRELSSDPIGPQKLSTASVDESMLAPRRRTKRPGKDSRISPEKQIPARAPMPLPGCAFLEEDVDFLHHTFIFQSIQLKRLQYLATQVRLIRVPKHEYLFTTGQDVVVYIVKSGQLRVFSAEQVRIPTTEGDEHELRDAAEGFQEMTVDGHKVCRLPLTTLETRHVELEILQPHDMIGLMEASLLQSTFSNYCIATTTDVWVYAVPPVALFTVFAHEPTASHHAIENLLFHHSWYKARKFTALNHHNKQIEFRLSLGAQRKSPIPCSRCGWSGHTSTSSMCVRAQSPKSAFIEHLMGKDEPCRAAPPQMPISTLRSRVERVSQLRLAHANRSGSLAIVPSVDSVPHNAGPRTGSLVVGRGGGMAGSLLPGIADLALLLKGSHAAELEQPVVSTLRSDVEKALDRLDAALQEQDHMPAITPNCSPRPKTQQLQRRRPGEMNHESPRGSVFDLREEALKVVARIGTATTGMRNPRATMRRKAIEDGSSLA